MSWVQCKDKDSITLYVKIIIWGSLLLILLNKDSAVSWQYWSKLLGIVFKSILLIKYIKKLINK